MTLIMWIKVILGITVLALFALTFKDPEHTGEDTFKYGRYMIYLLLVEVVLLLVFSIL